MYLVDFGLAYKYVSDGKHKDYKEDPKRLHDGTIEFTSRDAHRGATPSRRGDLEILGYCLLQWLCGKLPWEDKLNDKNYVAAQKHKYMKNIPSLMRDCFTGANRGPGEIQSYLEYVNSLEYDEKPDYDQCRKFFTAAMKKNGFTDDKLVLSGGAVAKAKAPTKAKAAAGRKPKATKRLSDSDDSEIEPPAKQRSRSKVKPLSPVQQRATSPGAAAQRVKSPTRAGRSTPKPRAKPARKSAEPKPDAKRRVKESCSVATQTSPGLKGLKRSWKK